MGLLTDLLQPVTFQIDGLITYLVELCYDCFFALFYPFYAILQMVMSWLMFIWNTFYNFVNGFIELANSFIDFFYSVFFSWMPAPVLMLLVLGVLIVLASCLYSYLKDVEIFGFKI